MEQLFNHIKSTVQAKTCPVHYQHPKAEISNDGAFFECCCREFELTCYEDVLQCLSVESTRQSAMFQIVQ